ncbi:MAG: hypothetical protein J3Q66DRAFT_441074 [Benniella sp.]|nr:MAG: hypothetical protein J3Q66DRAFT_441074 [Benniella sp.]
MPKIVKEPWEAEEMKILQEFMTGGPMDNEKRQSALTAINICRSSCTVPRHLRTIESLKCKLFRAERSKKVTSILPDSDNEKVIETLGDSLSGVKKEMASLNRPTATDRLDRTPVQCPYERWTDEEETLLGQFTKPPRTQEAVKALNELRNSLGKVDRTEKSIVLKVYKLANGENGILTGFNTDTVHEAVLNSLHNVDKELQLIGKRHRLDESQEEIRVLKRTLWRKRQESLEARRKEDLIHTLEIERIQELEEKLCSEFGQDEEEAPLQM